jgi:hypothetical protein
MRPDRAGIGQVNDRPCPDVEQLERIGVDDDKLVLPHGRGAIASTGEAPDRRRKRAGRVVRVDRLRGIVDELRIGRGPGETVIGDVDAIAVDPRKVDAGGCALGRVGERLQPERGVLRELNDVAVGILELQDIAVDVEGRLFPSVDEAGDDRVAVG